MPKIWKEVEVYIDLEDFETDELEDELNSRRDKSSTLNIDINEINDILKDIHDAYNLGKKELVEELTKQLIWKSLGRIV